MAKQLLHLHHETKDETYCGIAFEDRDVDFTYKRRRVTCKRCLKESDPGVMLKEGHAKQELERLWQQNQLKNGVKVTLSKEQRLLVRTFLKMEPATIIQVALKLDQRVSQVKPGALHLFNLGILRKNGKGYVVDTE
jgi:hypothetical protein